MENTIAAIGTALGEGGIGIVRLTGPKSEEIIDSLFKPQNEENWQNRKTHQLYLGNLKKTPEKEIYLDQVLVTIMKKPASFTGEDMGEIHCHGGILAVQAILEAVLDRGAVLAEPGEFTKRAFLNGKLDLTQAEATLDLIRASNEGSLKLATSQLKGNLAKKIEKLREELLLMIAYYEAKIDFPEENIEDMLDFEVETKLNQLIEAMEKLLAGLKQGRLLHEGLNTVIFGKPNVGKSSLLNALLGKERAIVTEIPGTTRDLIIEKIELEDLLLNLIDTAGIRHTVDRIEQIGVEKTKEVLKEADLALLVLDGGSKLEKNDYLVFELVKEIQVPILMLLNKIDLKELVTKKEDLKEIFPNTKIIEVSALEGQGLKKIGKEIKRLFDLDKTDPIEEPLLTRLRHGEELKKALHHVKETLVSLQMGLPEDFLTIDLRTAWEYLGRILGQGVEEDILDKIFNEFCIGK